MMDSIATSAPDTQRHGDTPTPSSACRRQYLSASSFRLLPGNPWLDQLKLQSVAHCSGMRSCWQRVSGSALLPVLIAFRLQVPQEVGRHECILSCSGTLPSAARQGFESLWCLWQRWKFNRLQPGGVGSCMECPTSVPKSSLHSEHRVRRARTGKRVGD